MASRGTLSALSYGTQFHAADCDRRRAAARIRVMKTLARVLLAAVLLTAPPWVAAQVSLNVSVNLAPPVLPVYVQPPLPAVGYLWTPGYWAWGDAGYYWVPGTWTLPPTPGYLWTPGYWAADGGTFLWHEGYWGPTVGFYGGINYGFGYGGVGFQGGYWRGGHLFYNQAVNNFGSVHISNVYNRRMTNVSTHVSYNGGPGGTRARPSAAQLAAAHGPHVQATEAQRTHVEAARSNASLRYSENHGRPAIAATARPGDFSGVHVAARGAGAARAPARAAVAARSPAERAAPETHAAPAQRAEPRSRAAPAEREQRQPREREPAHSDDREHH